MSAAIFGKHMEMGSMCRACLVIMSNDGGYSLLEEDGLALQFIECSSLTVDKFDEFPKCICKTCYKTLQKCHNFQKMCAESLDNFKTFINEQLNLTDKLQDNRDSNEVEINAEAKIEVEVHNNEKMYMENTTLTRGEEVNSSANAENTEPICFDETALSKRRSAKRGENGNMFFCTNCPKKFHKQERLQAHLRIHQGLKPYFCTVCSMEFTRSETMRNHMNRKHAATAISFTCTVEGCKKAYSAKHSLLKHISDIHNETAPSKKACICAVCGKAFAHSSLLSRHRYVHLEVSLYPFACVYCEKRFYSKQFLKQHLNRHAGLKMFACSYCGVRKFTNTELQRHMPVHQTQKKYTQNCSICDKHFSSSSNLKSHMRTKHECLRVFACGYCNKQFAKSGTLKNHELRHTGLRPHKCYICGYTFIQKGALNTHMCQIHKVENTQKIEEVTEI